MAHTESPAAEMPSDVQNRYGTPRRGLSRTAQKIAIIGALMVAAATTVWFTWGMNVGQLEYKDVGYTIISDTRASVEYQVTKDFDATAQCMLHVLDSSYAIVGSQIVTIGPHEGSSSTDRSAYYSSELRTEYRGVTGIVESCWLVD